MKTKSILTIGAVAVSLAIVGISANYAEGKDKYALKVPGGLAFSEFKGYESWQTISVSHNGPVMAVIVGNPEMIEAYQAGVPGNGKPFPDGAKMAKVHWKVKKSEYPGNPSVPDALTNVDFMVKDSKRFADSGGWGYGAFEYEGVRPVQARDHARLSSTGERRQVRSCVPLDREDERLRVHGVSAPVSALEASRN